MNRSNSISIPFQHTQSAHCESGVIVNLLNFHGLPINEPLAFGIGSGLFYTHLPFLKVNGIPVTSYRIFPGHIFTRLSKRLDIKIKSVSFGNNREKAMLALDKNLEMGLPTGMLTSVFFLPYLPAAFRFHFNAHNIVVFGKKGDTYLVSDPVMEAPTEIHRDDLMRARFPKGMPQPNGRMYYPLQVPKNVDWQKAVKKGLKQTSDHMANIPVPLFGVGGIRLVAKRLKKWPEKLGERKAILYLGNLIRMQEEIGTGGAGFRFMFAAFLQQAGKILTNDTVSQAAFEMTKIGDRWRDFAFMAGRICKGRQAESESFAQLSEIMMECADREQLLFRKILSSLK